MELERERALRAEHSRAHLHQAAVGTEAVAGRKDRLGRFTGELGTLVAQRVGDVGQVGNDEIELARDPSRRSARATLTRSPRPCLQTLARASETAAGLESVAQTFA